MLFHLIQPRRLGRRPRRLAAKRHRLHVEELQTEIPRAHAPVLVDVAFILQAIGAVPERPRRIPEQRHRRIFHRLIRPVREGDRVQYRIRMLGLPSVEMGLKDRSETGLGGFAERLNQVAILRKRLPARV